MNAEKLKQQLEDYGVVLFLDGDNIRFRFPGKQIPDAAKLLLDDLKQSKAEMVELLKPDMTKGRCITVAMVADSILKQAVGDINQGGLWQATPDVKVLEDEINRLYQALLEGLCTIQVFKEKVDQWKAAGTQTMKH